MPSRIIVRSILLAVAIAFISIYVVSALSEDALWIVLRGNMVASMAALIVCIAAGLSSRSLKRESRRLEFRKNTSESASKDATGWLPLRDSHYINGMGALITSVLLPLMWAASATAVEYARLSECATYGSGTTECNGAGWFVVGIMLWLPVPGVVVLTPVTYVLGRNVLRAAGKAYDWPVRLEYGTHPALKVAQTLRQVQFVLIWCWPVFFVFFVWLIPG